MFKLDGILMKVLTWITKFIHIQLLWIFFTLIGLVIGGIWPATFSMFAMIRKWIREHSDDPIFKTFWKHYKESFLKANFFGWFMTLLGYSIYFYFNWFNDLTGGTYVVVNALLIFFTVIFISVALFIIPVYVHYDIQLLDVFKFALTTSMTSPLHVLAMVLVVIVFWFLLAFFPFVFIFVGLSVLVYILMTIANAAFNKIDRKLKEI